ARLPTSIYALSLHDALPIYRGEEVFFAADVVDRNLRGRRRSCEARSHVEGLRWMDGIEFGQDRGGFRACRSHSASISLGQTHRSDRKSTRLNSSHVKISYAV